MRVFVTVDGSPETLGAFYVEGTGASEAGLDYASTGKGPAAAWDDPTEYALWIAGEEHLMGVAFPVDTYAQTFGALVVYDTAADGIDGGSVRYEITDAADNTTFFSISYPFTSGPYIAIDVTVGRCRLILSNPL